MDDSTKLMKFIMMLAMYLASLIGTSTMMILYHSMYMSTGRRSYIKEFNNHSDRARALMKELKKMGEEMA